MFSALPIIAISVASFGAAPNEPAEGQDNGLIQLEVMGHPGFIRGLKRGAAPQPWVWYAPTLTGAHPDPSHEWMFERFEAKGIAIAGVDVGESWGGDRGVKVFEAFHQRVTKDWGLAEKACLLPQSRGGLMLYGWAIKHPEQVACIAGIYPLTNLESFRAILDGQPGIGPWRDQIAAIHGSGPWVNFAEHLRPLAEAGVPILHLHGKADQVVPIASNSQALISAYKQHGGTAKLIALDNLGHEVRDGFFKSEALVRFVVHHACPKQGADGVVANSAESAQ